MSIGKSLLIGIAIIAVILAAAFLYPRLSPQGADRPTEIVRQEKQTDSLGAEIYEAVSAEPTAEFPETNPFSEETNPIKKAYKNPFE